ncbi:MAG: alpha/beta fold hydrolase [Pedobacter sp.]|nr:alpha/beta fold hydrolase [Pedobacter sp.]
MTARLAIAAPVVDSPSAYERQPSFPAPASPSAMRRVGAINRLLGRVSPALANRMLWKLWFTPQSIKPNARATALLASAEQRFEVYAGDEGALVSAWGQGPSVVLAHGWSTYGAQLGSFVQPLVAAGFRVLLFDAPGHGGKARREFRLDQYADLTEAVLLHALAHGGSVHAVVGHSLGAVAGAMALRRQNLPAHFVALAPSANLKTVLQTFQHKLALDEKQMQRLRLSFTPFFGPGWSREFSLETHFTQLRGPVLLVHDSDDAEAPLANSHYLQGLRPDAQLMVTQELGHNRVLHDGAVVQAVTRFLAQSH